MSILIQGDNLAALDYLAETWAGAVDLIYIDPPFATNNVYSISPGRSATISAEREGRLVYADRLNGTAYLDFLATRMRLAATLLKPTGSFYLHIDYKVGHHVKVMMDDIFGIGQFRNDITRIKCNPKNFHRKGYGNVKDMILFYTKSDRFTWNDARVPLSDDDINSRFGKVDESGRRYTTVPLHAPGETRNGATGGAWRGMMPPPGRHWRSSPEELERLDAQGLIEWSSTGNPRKIVYADQVAATGKKMQDVWEIKDPQYPDYPTQKPLELLRIIVEASSNPGEVVMDFFCGSGTTLVAAEQLGRRWIGVDNSEEAITLARHRLEGTNYTFVPLDNKTEYIPKPQNHTRRLLERNPLNSAYDIEQSKAILHNHFQLDSTETEQRLNLLVSKTGRSKSSLLREIIECGLDDIEDYYLASDVLERVRGGQEQIYTSAEVRRELGLDD